MIPDAIGRLQRVTVINESGMYALIFGSKLPNAKKFKHWVTSEVLPSIRKNGGDIQNQENLTPEQIVANALIVANKNFIYALPTSISILVQGNYCYVFDFRYCHFRIKIIRCGQERKLT